MTQEITPGYTDTCKIIRKLRLSRQSKRGGAKNQTRLSGCNHELPVRPMIRNDQYIHRPSKFFTLSTINAQSIKSKENMIHEMLVSDRIEVCLITETWLRPVIEDDTWVQASSLNTSQIRMSTVNRQNGRKGGLALLYNKEIKSKTQTTRV